MSKYKYTDYLEEEVKYRKKRKKKPIKRIDHKHVYKKVIILHKSNYTRERYMLGKKCEICGKVVIEQYMITIPVKDKSYSIVTDNLDKIKRCYPEYEEICELNHRY